MTVKHILKDKGSDIVTIQPHRTMKEAAQLLAEKRIGAVVVTGADRALLGILSERDIVRQIAECGENALLEPVSRFMTSKVVTCEPEASIDEIMELMTQGKFRHVPVLDSSHLIGIISIGDVVKYRLAQMEFEHRSMREYIAHA